MSAILPFSRVPLSSKDRAFADLQVIPARTSALDNFSIDPRSDACINKSPMGAEPGFQSEAIATLQLLSQSFLTGANGIPRPRLHPGKTTPVVLDFDR